MPKREPSSSAKAPTTIGRLGRHAALPEQVDRRERGDHAQRAVVRPAVEHRVEVRADQDGSPRSDPFASTACRTPPGEQVAVAVGLDLEVAGCALLAEPGAELGLDRGERLAEVAAARRRPAQRRESRHICSKSAGSQSVMLGPMEFQDVVRRRRMVRNYTDEPVDPAVVDRALRNATRAPSAGFSQGWGFLVLDTPDDVRRYWAATADELDEPDEWLRGMMRAPVRGACRARARPPTSAATPSPTRDGPTADEERWPVPFWHMDAAMASLLILQTAVDDGTRRLLLRHPARTRCAAVRAAFAIPEAFDPVGAITIGHPAARPGAQGSPSRRGARTSTRSCTAAPGGDAPADMGTSPSESRAAAPAGTRPGVSDPRPPGGVCAGFAPGVLVLDDGGISTKGEGHDCPGTDSVDHRLGGQHPDPHHDRRDPAGRRA